jgi:DNA (cytosine-5)-methyltransferase 3A
MGCGGGNVPFMFAPVADREKSHAVISSVGRTTEREYFNKNQGQLVFEPVGAAMRTREDENGKFKRLEVNGLEKSNALTSVQTDSMVAEPIRIGTLPNLGKGQANRIYSVRGKSVCLNANGGGGGAKTGLYKIDLPDGDYIVRKLTPRECARLQTYPERCFDVANISNTQWYKAFGNGWTVDVISHIFSQIPDIKGGKK